MRWKIEWKISSNIYQRRVVISAIIAGAYAQRIYSPVAFVRRLTHSTSDVLSKVAQKTIIARLWYLGWKKIVRSCLDVWNAWLKGIDVSLKWVDQILLRLEIDGWILVHWNMLDSILKQHSIHGYLHQLSSSTNTILTYRCCVEKKLAWPIK